LAIRAGETIDRGGLSAMKVLRAISLGLMAVCVSAASGCRTAGVGDLTRPEPALAAGSANVAAILAEHNRNAERIQVIRAKPDLTATIRENGKGDTRAPLSGRLALEQPRNFKLLLYHSASLKPMGDIGSNDNEYWFWINEKTQKTIYYCNYEDAEANPQAVAFQPDWIKEAMGLRVIPEDEASQITVKPGEPGTLVLIHQPHKAGGKAYTRVTILDKTNHQILEHRLLSADQKTLLARAEVPEGYQSVIDSSATEGGAATVLIPKRLRLHWVQEGLELDVALRDVQVNNPLSQSKREQLFIEPQLGKGYARKNLAELPVGTADAGPTTIRETRPIPPSGGVRLREPMPIDGADAGRDTRSTPIAFGGEGTAIPSLAEEVIGARFPAAAEPDYVKPEPSGPGWRAAASPALVRE
jgi:hypothetical protein